MRCTAGFPDHPPRNFGFVSTLCGVDGQSAARVRGRLYVWRVVDGGDRAVHGVRGVGEGNWEIEELGYWGIPDLSISKLQFPSSQDGRRRTTKSAKLRENQRRGDRRSGHPPGGFGGKSRPPPFKSREISPGPVFPCGRPGPRAILHPWQLLPMTWTRGSAGFIWSRTPCESCGFRPGRCALGSVAGIIRTRPAFPPVPWSRKAAGATATSGS